MDPLSETDNAAPRPLVVVVGGEDIEVAYLDGRTETVKVGFVPLKAMDTYLSAMGDDERAVELFCGRDAGWAASLTPKSQLEVFVKGQGLNLPLFETWYPEFQKKMEILRPGYIKGLANAVTEAMERLAKTGSPSTSIAPSSASEPASP
jgi:hypothetical protein